MTPAFAVAGPHDVGLSPALLARLDRLTFRSRRPVVGSGAGQRISPRPGTSAEFSDYRTYVAGDDFRRVDWNAYARLDRLMLRLYLGEEDLSVHLFVDTSASMHWGEPAKDAAARSIAAALAYVGLSGFDRLGVAGFADRVTGLLRPQRGRQSCPRVWGTLRRLGSQSTGPASDFTTLLPVTRSLRPGITVILSDFLTPLGGEDRPATLGTALAALRGARQQVTLLQVLAPQELDPVVAGDVALTDVETGARVDVTVTPALIAAYRDALEEHTERLRALARAHQALYRRVRSDEPLDLVVVDVFRRIGLLT
ncbi:MAG TPA: DUF58 domain-containing protein [Actinomycetota bacterium]|nr:DUF58 domain-containing protein [Actinomycetota bacterium]